MNEILSAYKRLQKVKVIEPSYTFVGLNIDHKRKCVGFSAFNTRFDDDFWIEISLWCAENCRSRYNLVFPTPRVDMGILSYEGEFGAMFFDQKEALMFKMKFG